MEEHHGARRPLASDSRWTQSCTASGQLMAPGYAEYEVRGAWNYARSAGYTEWTGLGMDRLTPRRPSAGS